jgi:hypothetical protein
MKKFLKKIIDTDLFLPISVLLVGMLIGIGVAALLDQPPKVELVVPETTAAAPVEETAEPAPESESELTQEMIDKGRALRQAEICINGIGYSKTSLCEMLMRSYNFSEEAATYAVDTLVVDWKEKAYEKLVSYLDVNKDWDYDRAYGQLEYEKFEKEEIEYALEKAGLKKAE